MTAFSLIDLTPRLADPEVRALLALAIGGPTPARIERVCGRYRTDPNSTLLGLARDGATLAVVGVRRDGPAELTITHIAVAPDAQRTGLGRSALDALRRGWRPRRIAAETDADAVGFYRRCGFAVEALGEAYPGVERFRCVWLAQG